MKKTRLTGLIQGVLVSLGIIIGNNALPQIATDPIWTNIAIPVVTIKAQTRAPGPATLQC